MKKNILLILDSFVTKANPSVGNLLLEQTTALETHYNFRIITLESSSTSIIDYFFKRKFTFKTDEFDTRSPFPIIRILFSRIRQNRISINMLKWKKLIIHFNFKQGCKALEAGYQKHLDDGIIFNLIFAQTAQYMAPFAVYLGKKHKIPVVATEHYPPLRQMTTVWDMDEITNGLIINSLNQVDRLFTVSQYVSSVLYLLGVKNRMYNVGNMVDERLFIIKDGIRSEPFYVTFIGYNYFVKDPLTMFKAIAEIKKQGVKNIRFRLINSVNDFIELVNRFQVQDYVELLIQVPRPEMIKIITENTDLLVSTSICETFGLSMVEALLSGIPVVATNSGGPQDFLNAGNSIIIENMDYMGLTNAILKIKNKEITFDRNALRNSVINKFGTEAFTHRLVKQINEIAYL